MSSRGSLDTAAPESGDGRAGPDGPPAEPEERFLRPYAVTAGDPGAARAVDPGLLDLLTPVVAVRTEEGEGGLWPEREAILYHARSPRTVAELAARVDLPVGQVRAIAAGMVEDGSLRCCEPTRSLRQAELLQAVLEGLEAL